MPSERGSEKLPAKGSRGFTLMELLAVMAIMGLTAWFAVPAFQSIGQAQNMSQGVYDVGALLELAQQEASTRQTYVWVGFRSDVVDGSQVLQMAAVRSRDGSDSATRDNLVPITRVLKVKNAAMSRWSELKKETHDLYSGPAPSSIAANAAGISFSVGQLPFSGNTVTFTPGGQAMLQGSPGVDGGYDPVMEISIRQTRGVSTFQNAEDAAVLLFGSTGLPRIVRQK